MLLIFVGLLYSFHLEGWNFNKQLYLHCPGPTVCKNPLYQSCTEYYCDFETLPPGFTIGKPMSAVYDRYPLFVFAVVMIAFLANHFVYNKDFEPPAGMAK